MPTPGPNPKDFGPNEKIPENLESGESVSFWAEISANDDTGVSVDGVQAGDVIKIETVTGICSFDGDRLEQVTSVIGLVSSIATGGLGALFKQMSKKLPVDENLGSKRRNGFGMDDNQKYTEKEGGIVVCMPAAVGVNPMEPAGLSPKTGMRISNPPYYFPRHGHREFVAAESGVIVILAFDKNYEDNAGIYEVKFTITRKP